MDILVKTWFYKESRAFLVHHRVLVGTLGPMRRLMRGCLASLPAG